MWRAFFDTIDIFDGQRAKSGFGLDFGSVNGYN